MLYVREDTSAKLLIIEKIAIEESYLELNSKTQKWLISCSCNPKKDYIGQHVEALSKTIDLYSSTNENVILFG